jgi:hypothetical protein
MTRQFDRFTLSALLASKLGKCPPGRILMGAIRAANSLYRAKTSLGVVSWPFTEVRLPCGIR